MDSFFAKGSFQLSKKFYAGCLLEEGPFADGPIWMVSLQRAPWTIEGQHFSKGSLLLFCRGLFFEGHFAKGGSLSVKNA